MKLLMLLCAAALLAVASARAIGVGSTQDDVIAELGQPLTESKAGPQTTLMYPKGTVRLRNGQVTDISPLLLPAGALSPGKITKKGSSKLDLAKVLVKDKITVIDFYADWCGPCKRMAPVLADMAAKDADVYLCKVNIKDWDSPVAKQFALRGIPHVRVYGRDGKQVGEGTSQLEQIAENLQKAKAAAPPAPGG